jgi:hypothetical protein
MTKKSAKCTVLLASLLLLSVGVNYVFIGTAGGRMVRQAQQVQREGSALQQASAVVCTAERCSIEVR